MKLSSLRYILPEPFISMKRNKLMSVSAVATVAITLFLCGFFGLLLLNINNNAAIMESSVEVKVFLTDGVNEENRGAFEEQLKAIEGVKSVKFVSKDEGLNLVSGKYGDSNRITAALDENPLPDSFTVTVDIPEDVANVAAAAEKLENVEAVRYGEGSVEKLFVMMDWLQIIGAVIMGLLAISAMVLIYLNIRLTVTARKDEVSVMKLVGASNAFITWPFLLEGVVLAGLGAIIAVIGLAILYTKAFTYLASSLMFLVFVPFSEIAFPVISIMIGAGILLGLIGSFFAVHKFLNV